MNRLTSVFIGVILAFPTLLGTASSAYAQACKSSGNLNYIGRTSDDSRSVWLSLTQNGDFALEAAQGNTRVDTFSRSQPGARFTLSPFVSNGSGGTHRLFELNAAANGGDCLVDTQNQKNGIVLPPRPPGLIRPPIGVMPPIAVLPPSGVMPTRPGRPTLPGRPTPPIATLPPAGVTPARPGRPTPPIGTLPPAGVTPTLPGQPSPPIGTLPPTGVTPTLPGQPSPPIGTLPPTGVTPTLPGQPSPPIGTLPPGGGTPTQPGQPTPPIGTLPTEGIPAGALASDASAQQNRCAQASTGKPGPAPCDKTVVPPQDVGIGTAPITPGRDLAPPSDWNVWTDVQITRTDDDRNGSMVDQNGAYIGVGIDRRITENVVVGIQLQYEEFDSESFGGFVSVDTSTISIGPYVSMILNDNWSVSGLLTYGQMTSDVGIAGLDGSVDQNRTTAIVTATGQYSWGNLNVRPQASLDYTYTSAGDLRLDGTLAGLPLSIVSEVQSGWNGTFTPSVEFNRVFVLPDALLVPFAEIGLIYSFGESGGILSNAQDGAFEEWVGTVRVGTRARMDNGLFVEASLGYNSLFADDLDSVDAGLYLAWSF